MANRFIQNIRQFIKNADNKKPIQMICIISSMVICFIMSICISVVFYRNKVQETKNSKTIKKKNRELKELNLELGELNLELEKLSNVDFLTNVYNRRKFEEVLRNEWNRAIRDKRKIAVIMLDIDFFKQYNDFYGHAEGDECLRRIGAVLNNCVKRRFECVARYGGEEFACILPNTSVDEAYRMCEIIQRAVYNEKIQHEKSAISNYLTASFGIACFSPDIGASSDDLIKAADDALYYAKKNGRDRIEISGRK